MLHLVTGIVHLVTDREDRSGEPGNGLSATLARDLKILCEENYQLEKVAVCDMFPSSVHVETVACLERK